MPILRPLVALKVQKVAGLERCPESRQHYDFRRQEVPS
jgi:hypothetical protein